MAQGIISRDQNFITSVGAVSSATDSAASIRSAQYDPDSRGITVHIVGDDAGIGGGTQYTEGDTDTTITGTAILMEGGSNTLLPVQGTVADGLLVNLGSNNDISGTVTANLSATDNAVLDDIAANQTDATQKTQIVDGAGAVIGSTSNALDVNIASGSSAGTEYTEDVATPAAIDGGAVMLERDDQLATVTPAEGDWISLRGTSKGALWVALADSSGDPITSFGGGTEYTEDVATANPQVGKAIMMERDDALSTVTPIEGDWIGLRGSAEGALWVQEFNSDAILADTANMDTNLGTIAGAVSGSEMQVDVVAALPAGTNAIGKLSANSGVDIGDVDVLSLPSDTFVAEAGALGKGVLIQGDDGTDRTNILVDTSGHLQIDVLTAPSTAVTNAGTFAVQVDGDALTALQLIDNIVQAEDAIHGSGDSGVMALAVRNDTLAALAGTDGDYAPLQVNADGALFVDNSANTQPVSGTVTAELSATDNAVLDTIDAVLDTINAKLVSGTDIGDVTINNASAGSAVNIQDGGNSITVDGSLTVDLGSNNDVTTELTTDDLDTGAGTDTRAVVGLVGSASGGGELIPGSATNGLLVNLGSNNDISGTVTANLSATDNAVLDQIELNTDFGVVVGGGTEATALRVTIANNSTGVVSVDDNGGALTVDGTVTANLSATDNAVLDDIAAKLGTIDADTSILAAAVSTEYQVDVVGSLPAGTNAIGKLSANSGVDIGDVDVTSVTPGNNANQLGKSDDLAHSASDVGVMALSVRTDTPNAALTSADGDYQPIATYRTGALRIAPPEEDFAVLGNNSVKKYYTNAGAVTDGIVWSPSAGKRWYITDIFINVSAAATVTLEDDLTAGDAALWKAELAAKSGWTHTFSTPLFSGEDAADLLVTTDAGNVYIMITGYEI